MEDSLKNKLLTLNNRYDEIGKLMSDPEVLADQNRYRELGKEYANLSELITYFREFLATEKAISDAQELLTEGDAEMKQLAEEESKQLKEKLTNYEAKIKILLLPKDPNDARNVFLEIRGGAGGDEASIFAGELFRMYSHYAEDKGWRVELLNANPGEHGGFKEVIARIIGEGAYSRLKFESGVHRVQRVPKTESAGRIHTSTCTVAILPEVEEIDAVKINPVDLKIDTFRSSGAGGQHVNVTDSAVRITHLPTGVVVECQNERSQHQNRAKAMALLQARLLEAEREKQRREQAQTRKSQVGTGDRSERIRTYNFPQSRLTDHRINLTLYNLEEIMEGKLDQVVEPLIRDYQAAALAEIA